MTEPGERHHWPDPLAAPEPEAVQRLLVRFWACLRSLPDLLARDELLLAAESVVSLRAIVLEMMLALNGIQRPAATTHLNSYLSQSQRAALQRTLVAPAVDADAWIGQAVALVVIYRWYAPQLVQRYALTYPAALEREVWTDLQDALPAWPAQVTTD